MNMLTQEDLEIGAYAATTIHDYLLSGPDRGFGFAAAPSAVLENTVIVPSSKLLSQTSYNAAEERVNAQGDYVLEELLHAGFLTVVPKSQWEYVSANARRFDLESLAPHKIFLRIKTLDDNNFLLLPDDRLEAPSLMFQVLVFPWRVGVLNLGLADGTLQWSVVMTGPCSALTGRCEPSPPCEWRFGQDGAGTGWLCC